MRKLIWLVVLVAASWGSVRLVKRYVAQHSADRREAMEALNVRANITVAELTEHLGDPVRTRDGFSWNSNMVRAYTPRTDGAAEPYIIQINQDYSGQVLGRTLVEYGKVIAASHSTGQPWTEIGTGDGSTIWYASWTRGAGDQLLSLSLIRMTRQTTRQEAPYCPEGYKGFVEGSQLALDVR